MTNQQQVADETKKAPGQGDTPANPQDNQRDSKQGSEKPAQQR